MRRTRIGKWIVTFIVIGLAAAGALTVQRWLPAVAQWVNANSDTVQGLQALIEIALWTVGGLTLISRLWLTARARPEAPEAQSGLLPPLPPIVVGREKIIADLKRRILDARKDAPALIVITGWPGVGKSTVAAALAHDSNIAHRFDTATLWVALGGEHADVRSILRAWGRVMGVDLSWELDKNTLRAKLIAHLAGRRCFFILDDVWTAEQVELLRIGSGGSALLVTTRLPSVAAAVAPVAEVVSLPGLAADDALELLNEFAPRVVAAHRASCRDLVEALEGLPLAIHVAGRLLAAEARSGLDVGALLESLRSGVVLLDANAPTDMMHATTPTVAILLEKSTEHLDPVTLERFAALGVMAGKENAFDLEALKTMWNTAEPEPTVRVLVDRGLLEYDRDSSRYRMHSLLLLHAQALLQRGTRAHAG